MPRPNAARVWLATHAFILPEDTEPIRNRLYPGLAILPLAPICSIVAWTRVMIFIFPAASGYREYRLTPTLQSASAEQRTLAGRLESSHGWPRLDRQVTEYAIVGRRR
jgi:hypothetical protein